MFEKSPRLSKGEQGQSTIEFLLSFIFAFAFLLIFVKTAINITNGFMVHYATFLASRTYLVWDNNSNTPSTADNAAATMALETFRSIPLPAIFWQGFEYEPVFNSPEGPHAKLFTGVYINFQSRMNLGSVIGGNQPLELTSESFLLREPTRAECLQRICYTMGLIGANCEVHATLEDNGC